MNRRDLLKGSAMAAGAASLAGVLGTRVSYGASPLTGQQPLDVTVTTADCIRTGEKCVAHCVRELGKGRTEFAHCNASVHTMLAACKAMLSFYTLNLDYAKRHAELCADICRDCAAACFEHSAHWVHGMDLECKECYEACLACEKACRQLIAA